MNRPALDRHEGGPERGPRPLPVGRSRIQDGSVGPERLQNPGGSIMALDDIRPDPSGGLDVPRRGADRPQ